jgi:dimethylhistidine N-methyltransferase
MSAESKQSNQLSITRFSSEDLDNFARDVRKGLNSAQKTLLPKYFYDELGSRLFEAICFLPEYYVTRDESEIIRENIREMIEESRVAPKSSVNLIELGSGSSDKTRYFIEALLEREVSLRYIPIDVSESSLERSSKELMKAYPNLKIAAFATDYFTGLGELAKSKTAWRQPGQRTIALFLGSSIGNLDADESRALLLAMREVLEPDDSFVLGADLKKEAGILLPAYNDALGVTAAFNLNLLVRINREFDGNFDLDKFEHRAIYNEDLGRIEMHLFSRETHAVKLEALELEIHFEKGESIHTENSYKFKIDALSDLASQTHFHLTKTWFDGNRRFSVNLLTPTGKD